MNVTARCLAAFATVLEPADLVRSAPKPGPGPSGADASPDSLIRFEGALAWESGEPRSAVPAMMVDWARDAWLAGWDHADARFYHAERPVFRGAA